MDTQWLQYDQSHGIFGPLIRANDIFDEKDGVGLDKYTPREVKALRNFAGYAINFLAHEDAKLGRSGPVCPYVPDALRKELLWLTATSASHAKEVEDAMRAMTQVFIDLPPSSAGFGHALGDQIYKAIVVVFPNVAEEDAATVIGNLQKRLKPAYIRDGLMIGEFYPSCPEPGLWSKDFRPLDAPEPALAVRHITKMDAVFMIPDKMYIDGYVERFGSEGQKRIDAALLRARSCPMHQNINK